MAENIPGLSAAKSALDTARAHLATIQGQEADAAEAVAKAEQSRRALLAEVGRGGMIEPDAVGKIDAKVRDANSTLSLFAEAKATARIDAERATKQVHAVLRTHARKRAAELYAKAQEAARSFGEARDALVAAEQAHVAMVETAGTPYPELLLSNLGVTL